MSDQWACRVCATTNAATESACVVCHEPRTAPDPVLDGPQVPVATVTSAPPAVAEPAAGAGLYQRQIPPAPPAADSTPTPEEPKRVAVAALIAVVLVGLVVIGALVTRGSGGSDTGPPEATDASAGAGTEPTLAPSTASATTALPPTTSATPAAAEPVQLATTAITARASSILSPVESRDLTYGPENLLDGDLDTAWSQAGSEGSQDPIGSWVTFDLPQATDITTVSIINGYVKSDKAYTENARARNIVISTDDGREARATLADVRSLQSIAVDFPGATTITITVESVYDGDKYPDVALTEVRFSGLVTG